MHQATFAEVCGWVICSWAAVKTTITTIINGFKKAGIISGQDETEDEEAISDHSSAELDKEFFALFQTHSEDEDFEGFPYVLASMSI